MDLIIYIVSKLAKEGDCYASGIGFKPTCPAQGRLAKERDRHNKCKSLGAKNFT